ncbi:hypothetical protein [Shewanella atlantica]|nr:hypothetical protein [Shewanella atlantica]
MISYLLTKNIDSEQVYDKDFVNWCANEFKQTQKLMGYLCFALDLDY